MSYQQTGLSAKHLVTANTLIVNTFIITYFNFVCLYLRMNVLTVCLAFGYQTYIGPG